MGKINYIYFLVLSQAHLHILRLAGNAQNTLIG